MAEPPPLSGTILDVPAADPRLVRVGDPTLAEVRGRLFRSWVRETSQLRKGLLLAAKEVNEIVLGATFSADGQRILARSARIADTAVRRSLGSAFDQIESGIEEGVVRAIRRATRAQRAHLEKLGLKRLPRSVRREIHRAAMRGLDEEFPLGSGMAFRNRLDRVRIEHTNQMAGVVRRSHSVDASARVQREVSTGLAHTRAGRTPLVGGSALKKAQRILVAEETRLANFAEVQTVRASGVTYAYWRLNPAHRWYGGKEICEHLASVIVPEVQDELARLGLPDATVQGLHKVGSWPQYPHPYCKCYPEAWLHPGSSLVIGRTGLLQLNLLTGTGSLEETAVREGSETIVDT